MLGCLGVIGGGVGMGRGRGVGDRGTMGAVVLGRVGWLGVAVGVLDMTLLRFVLTWDDDWASWLCSPSRNDTR